MPFNRPTLPELIDQGAAEIETRLPGLLARARRSVIGVLNRVLAVGLSALYGFFAYLDRQKWPDLSDGQYLVDHGNRWGVYRNPATFATGSVAFTGTNGSTIASGTQLQRADDVLFATTALGTIASGTATVPVVAVVAGVAGNTLVNTRLSLTSPIAGVTATALVSVEVSDGTDVESDDDFRDRILRRIRKPPQGGAKDDYVDWAMAVPGVTRVWVYPQENGAGTVVVRFVRDGDADFIPDGAEVSVVQLYIDTVRPVTASVTVEAPVSQPINPSIKLIPDTAEGRLAVQASLEDLLRRAEDEGGTNKPGGTVEISQIREAISIAPGETDYMMTAPTASIALPANTMAVLGTITWLP